MGSTGSLAVAWGALAALYLLTLTLTAARYGRARAGEAPLPRCSIIVPIKGLSTFVVENVAALGRLVPFSGEILIAVVDERDPAVEALTPVVARHADRMTLMVGEAREFANPKLRNLAKAYRAAREDVILFLDDTVALHPHLYRELLATLDAGTAAATAAMLGCDAQNLPAQIEAATCNGYQLRMEMLLEPLGAAAAFGSALAFRKRDLEAAGGLARLAQGPCEDNALSKAIRGGGGRLTLVPIPVTRRIGRRSWRDLWLRLLRWTNCAKCHDPLLFALEPLVGGLCFNLVGAFALSSLAGIPWLGALALSMALWYGLEAALHILCRWPMTPLTPVAWVLRDLLYPVVMLKAAFTRRVEWRGETIEMRVRWPWSAR